MFVSSNVHNQINLSLLIVSEFNRNSNIQNSVSVDNLNTICNAHTDNAEVPSVLKY